MHTDENELTADEHAALAALPREMAPSDLLEERVVRALRADGNFGAIAATAKRRQGRAFAWRVAAAAALFIGGIATGRYLLVPETPQSAVVVPETDSAIRPAATTPPPGGSRNQPARNSEPAAVALEMWL